MGDLMGDLTGDRQKNNLEPNKRGNQSVLIPLGASVFRSVRWYESRSLWMRNGSLIRRHRLCLHDV